MSIGRSIINLQKYMPTKPNLTKAAKEIKEMGQYTYRPFHLNIKPNISDSLKKMSLH